MPIILPNTSKANTDPNLFSDTYENDLALKEGIETETSERKAEIASQVKPLITYPAKVIATEETKTSTSFVTMTTPDEVSGVVVPENGVLSITYSAYVKSSSSGEGVVCLFIGSNRIPTYHVSILESFAEIKTVETVFSRITTTPAATIGMEALNWTSASTTGRMLLPIQVGELAAGTYTVSARYKAAAGSVTAKERILRVSVTSF
jgi:hypothetical protein